ncbi:glycosyltransferase family 2 protein [Rossellomorea vietnamensis]|uniref:Glycosyltransferase family 2 protein n=1 Tax=Rossellomorea vietnamensis TaxID=218284 RepID=A0ACD4C907_9BACI|nr:glycosyltransferase family 2 protein [Rossellomorea vietnamensis]UXH44896.1 glycosyltransferase family 2 protein [Rossellomorea vietnamensis]
MYFWIVALGLTIFLFTRIPTVKNSVHVRNSYLVKKCSIIIPARNEEKTIGRLLSSIRMQFIQPLEVIVVNDGSTDQTKAIALNEGAIVIDAPPLPNGWNGKSWACWNGAKESKGEFLLFVDSDTWFEQAGLLKICETYKMQQCQGVLTIHPFHKMETFYETFSMLFHLMVFASTSITHLFSWLCTPSGGFGQFFLCSRAVYERLGGHEAIKGEMVEHFALSQWAKKCGESVEAASGRNAISMRMYGEGIGQLFHGWSKSFASGAKSTNILLLGLSSLWMASLIALVIHSPDMIREYPYLFIIHYILLGGYFYFLVRRIGNFSVFETLLFPVHILFFLATFLHSFLNTFFRKRTTWKDRYVYIEKGKNEKMK